MTQAQARFLVQPGECKNKELPYLKLELVPVTLEEANAFVATWHRHHKPVPGAKFCIGVADAGHICGVAIVGRPVARMADDGWTLEVNRTCTDGTRNANSLLYAAARRAAWALGYKKLITYTLPEESGSSLKGAGFRVIGLSGGGPWSRESRPRIDTHPQQKKIKWEVVAVARNQLRSHLGKDILMHGGCGMKGCWCEKGVSSSGG